MIYKSNSLLKNSNLNLKNVTSAIFYWYHPKMLYADDVMLPFGITDENCHKIAFNAMQT